MAKELSDKIRDDEVTGPVTLNLIGFDKVPIGCQAIANEKGEVYGWGKGRELLKILGDFRKDYPNQVTIGVSKLDPNIHYIFNMLAAA